MSAKDFASLYVDNVFPLFVLSRGFITCRDARIHECVWRGVTNLLGTKRGNVSFFHSLTDGQIEMVYWTLENVPATFWLFGVK